jgi:hypothetical protein
MDFLYRLLDWAGDSANSAAVRTIVALLAIPGALWGMYLFTRWMRGRDLASAIDKANEKLDSMISVTTTNNQVVSFKKDDVRKLINICNSTRYHGSFYDFTLSDALTHAAGVLNDYHGDYNYQDFLRPMSQFFSIARSDLEYDMSPKGDNKKAETYRAELEHVVKAVLGDCIALEMLYTEVLGAVGRSGQEVHYFLTNFGRAVVKDLRINAVPAKS